MEAEGKGLPSFLPWTVLAIIGDLAFVHYQTPNPEVPLSEKSINFTQLDRQSWNIPADVAQIRFRQESDAVRLIEDHLSEPYTIAVYRYFLRHWPHLCIFAYKGSCMVGAVVGKLDCESEGLVCMVHSISSFRESFNRGVSDVSAGSNVNGSDDTCEGVTRCILKDSKPASSSDSPHPALSRKQRQRLRAKANKAAQLSDAALSGLCLCLGQSKSTIGMLAVLPELRGRGIGKHLVRLALRQQQRFVRAAQDAAAAAAPECISEQRRICEIILASPPSPPALSSDMEMKLRQAVVAVGRAMVPTTNGDAWQAGVPAVMVEGKFSEKPYGLRYCWLDMEAGNEAALRLYTGVGFVIAGYRRRYYCSGKDAYKLVYVFGPPPPGKLDSC